MQKPNFPDRHWKLFLSIVVVVSILWRSSLSSVNAQGPSTPTALPATALITPQNAGQVKQLTRFGNGTVGDISWSPMADTVAVTGSLGLWLYDAHNLNAQPRLLEIPRLQNPKGSLEWSPDGRLLAFLDADNIIQIWTVSDGAPFRTFSRFSDDVFDFVISADSHTMATINRDKSLRSWDITTGNLIQTRT